MSKKILQILPATGWRAVYSKEPGGSNPDFDVSVVCFALVEEANGNEIDTRVIPYIFTDLSDDAESDNFLGLVSPGSPKEAVGDVTVQYGRDGDRISKIVKKAEAIRKGGFDR